MCDSDHTYTVHQWAICCRIVPKRARAVVRKNCDAPAARSVTLSETRPNIAKLEACRSCYCGKSFSSTAAYAVHAFKAHGIIPPVCVYAPSDGRCRCCLLQFDTRQGLIDHLSRDQRGGNLCLLNCLLRIPPLSREEETEARAVSQAIKIAKVHKGEHQHFRERPAVRVYGPMWRLIDIDGNFVSPNDKRHPVGPGKQWRSPFDPHDLIIQS